VRVDTAFRVSGRSPQQDRTESQILRHQAPGPVPRGLELCVSAQKYLFV